MQRIAGLLKQEGAAANKMLSQLESGGSSVVQEKQVEVIRRAQFNFVSAFPTIVEAKASAFACGEWRIADQRKLVSGYHIHDLGAPCEHYAVTWTDCGEDLGSGWSAVVFRIRRATYPVAYEWLAALAAERRSDEYVKAARDQVR